MVVKAFDNLIGIVQMLNWYSNELLGVSGIIYYLQLTNAGCLHIARKARRYSSFEIGIEDIVIVALDPQYQHFAGMAGEGQPTAVNDAERIERLFSRFRYPMKRDAELVKWSMVRRVLQTITTAQTAQQLGKSALQLRKGDLDAKTKWLQVPLLLAYGCM